MIPIQAVLEISSTKSLSLSHDQLFYFVCNLPVRFLSKRFFKTASEGSKTAFFWCNICPGSILLQISGVNQQLYSYLDQLIALKSLSRLLGNIRDMRHNRLDCRFIQWSNFFTSCVIIPWHSFADSLFDRMEGT
jgi:hypothetical protein